MRALLLLLAAVLPAADDPGADRDRLQGTWVVASAEFNGREMTAEELEKLREIRHVIESDKWTVKKGDDVHSTGTITLDPAASPPRIDYTIEESAIGTAGRTWLGIYRLEGDTLTLCQAFPGKDRPTEFTSKPETDVMIRTFRRVGASGP